MYSYIGIAAGYLYSFFLPSMPFSHIPGYTYLLYVLLAVGLYGSVYGIDTAEFHTHRKVILNAITFGVILKNIIIGLVLSLFIPVPLAFLFAVIVTQIDPLSVSYLVDKQSDLFTKAGRTILRAWSSFDDPMTVLLALYIYLPIALSTHFSFVSYITQLGLNLLFAGVVYFLWRGIQKKASLQLVLLILAFIVAVPTQLMLGIAIIGLYLRPKIPYLEHIIQAAFILAAIILGSLITFNISLILVGVVLGVVAFAAQAIAAYIVARNLGSHDKKYLAVAQYNGITSIILALIISQYFAQTIVIIASALIVINTLYYSSNALLKKHLMSSVA